MMMELIYWLLNLVALVLAGFGVFTIYVVFVQKSLREWFK